MATPQQLYEQWFRIADTDKDGAVGGAEAVQFFMRSGLQQAVLGQIWDLASGGGPKLNQFQFSSAMRLVALAQVSGGSLAVEQARAIVAGVGPQLPPPTLQGLEVPGSAAARPAAPAAPYGPQVTGGMPGPSPYTAQATGGAPAMPYMAQATGGAPAVPYMAQMTGGGMVVPPGAPAILGPGIPPMGSAEMSRYQASFVALDADRDGYVTGSECFGFFLQSGLDKAVLRDIWALVAGSEGRLTAAQFVVSMHLQDMVRRGTPLPSSLPPGLGSFPAQLAAMPQPAPGAAAPAPGYAPVAGAGPVAAGPTGGAAQAAPATWSLQSQFGTSSNIAKAIAAPQVFSQAMAPPAPLQQLPPRADFSGTEKLTTPQPLVSKVPHVPAELLAGVSAMDRTKLQEEQQVSEAKEKALQTAEERAAEARARQAQLTTVLQELVVFRNRTEVALLTSQDQARRLEEEVEASRKRYDAAYTAAQAASEKSAVVHSQVMELMGQKVELEEKMRRLEGEIAAAERMGPADVARLEAELAELGARVAAAEASRNAKTAKVDGIRKQQEALSAQLAALRDADRDVGSEVAAAQSELDALAEQLKEARAGSSLAAVPSLLSRAAAAYRGLYGLAQRSGGDAGSLPLDALPATLTGLHVWADEVAAGVMDWPDDDADARGFVMVNALPGADAPRPIVKGPAGAAATAAKGAAGPGPAAAAAPPAAKALPEDFGSRGGADGFGDAPAFGEAPAFGIAAAASGGAATAAAAAPAAPPAAAAPGFGDNAFGGTVFGAADSFPSAAADAPAAEAAPHSPSMPPPLAGVDSGALEENPFASGPPPGLAAFPGSGAVAAAAAAAPVGFGDEDSNPFGASPPAQPEEAPAAAATAAAEPPTPAAEPAAAAAAAASPAAAAEPGFGGDNAFGAEDNPFSPSGGGAPPAAAAATPAPAPAPLPAVGSSTGGAAAASTSAGGGFDDNAFGEPAFGDNAFGAAPAAPAAAPAQPAAAPGAAFGFEDSAF